MQVQHFDRNTARLILGIGAPIYLSIHLWDDLIKFLSSQGMIQLAIHDASKDITNLGNQSLKQQMESLINYIVVNEFSIMFQEEEQLFNQQNVYKFNKDDVFPKNFTNSILATLRIMGYKEPSILSKGHDDFLD